MQSMAILAAAVGLIGALVQWRWHTSDERANALQESWLSQDKEWNAEIIRRLRVIEERCGRTVDVAAPEG